MKYICVKVKGERIKQDSDLWSGQRRQWHPTPVLLPGKSRRQRSLVGCGPWGREESDTTEQLHLHFSLSCIGEGNGNPLQCSCLENPRNRGAWWAALYGAAQSWTQLRRPSSSSMVWVTGWGLVHACRLIHFGCVWLFVTLWMVAHQAPLSMEFSRQQLWSGLPCPSPEDLPNPGTFVSYVSFIGKWVLYH